MRLQEVASSLTRTTTTSPRRRSTRTTLLTRHRHVIAQVDHPNLVRLREVVAAENESATMYIVMELVDGGAMSDDADVEVGTAKASHVASRTRH